MSTKHYPFYGGSFDRIIFDGDGSVWVPESENAKLRDEIDQWHRLTAGIELPEYPITEFQPKDLERENAKLRELCEWLLTPYRLGAVTGEGVDRQWCRETYDGGSYRLRELGIEVG